MRLKLDLDTQTWEALAISAVRELRPAPRQAEVLLMRALGVPFPKDQRPDVAREEEPATEIAI
jgi:hypothetical protein